MKYGLPDDEYARIFNDGIAKAAKFVFGKDEPTMTTPNEKRIKRVKYHIEELIKDITDMPDEDRQTLIGTSTYAGAIVAAEIIAALSDRPSTRVAAQSGSQG